MHCMHSLHLVVSCHTFCCMPDVALGWVVRFPRGDRHPGISPEGRCCLKLPHQLLSVRQSGIGESAELSVVDQIDPPPTGPGRYSVKGRLMRLTTATAIASPASTVAMQFLA